MGLSSGNDGTETDSDGWLVDYITYNNVTCLQRHLTIT